MNTKEEIEELGKLFALRPGESRREILLCVDLVMTADKAEKDLTQIIKASASQGLKIVELDCGLDLIYEGQAVDNRMRNKIKLTLEQAAQGEGVINSKINPSLSGFFTSKIIPESDKP